MRDLHGLGRVAYGAYCRVVYGDDAHLGDYADLTWGQQLAWEAVAAAVQAQRPGTPAEQQPMSPVLEECLRLIAMAYAVWRCRMGYKPIGYLSYLDAIGLDSAGELWAPWTATLTVTQRARPQEKGIRR
jgi:hypothetical protein